MYIMPEKRKSIEPMQHYKMSEFLRGQASGIITKVADEDRTGFVCKHGGSIAVLMSNERYERLLKAGIDIK